jgi:hypothetical protein
MPSAKIEVANNALSELGAQLLTALPMNNLESDTVLAVYDDVYEDLLGKAPWRFATKKADLSREVTTPLNEWTYQFVLPPQCMRILRVYPHAPYEMFEGKIYSDSDALAVDFVERVSESLWPPPFVRLMSLELAVRMCMAITNDVALKKSLQDDTRMQFAAALAADAQQRPNIPLQSSPFTAVRY